MESNKKDEVKASRGPVQSEEEMCIFGPPVNDVDFHLIMSGERDYISKSLKIGEYCLREDDITAATE